MSAAEAAPPVSRKARVLKRTAIGLALASAVVAMLILAGLSESGWVVIGTGLALSALSCFELARLGAFARRGWAWVLAPCWLLVLALAVHTLRWAGILRTTYDSPVDRFSALNQAYEPDLRLEVVCVALLAVVLRFVVDGLGARKPLRSLVALGLLAWAGWWTYLFLSHADEAFGLNDSDWGTFGLAAALLVPALVGLAWTARWERGGLRDLVRAAWIAPLLVLPLPWMWHVWQRFEHGGLAALIVLAKVGDIAGYYVGSAIGKRHPFPSISPGKTVAGCWGSFLVGTAAGGVLVAAGLLPDGRLGIAGGLLAGAATNLAAQAGDLLESWLKRRAGVKDSGQWFGPAGGVLDLVDSLLLAVPTSLLVWPWCLA
jgi:phosphatidate cytidylyltransferase